MDMIKFANLVDTPEFDYNFLISLLQNFKSPRDQITKMIKKNYIIRVKKGIYVLGPIFNRPFSNFVLANMIYGPSYISGKSALSHYRLIPERVEIITSSTPNKNKKFATPVATFTYSYISMKKYQTSVLKKYLDDSRAYLIASPEKAIVEVLIKELKTITSYSDIKEWVASMRLDQNEMVKLRISELLKLNMIFKKQAIEWLIQYIRGLKNYA